MPKTNLQKATDVAKRSILRIARKTPGERAVREALAAKKQLSWWCVYGSTRSGTTYISRLAKSRAKLWTGDWRMGVFLVGLQTCRDQAAKSPDFDFDRLLSDISANIIDNAYSGDGDQLDLVYKQAALRPREYEALVRMWGPPQRLIFCLREPAGYIASAVKKFPTNSLQILQENYVMCLDFYEKIGGDIYEYNSELTLQEYIEFLSPLELSEDELPAFRFKGVQDEGNVTPEMQAAYDRIKTIADSKR